MLSMNYLASGSGDYRILVWSISSSSWAFTLSQTLSDHTGSILCLEVTRLLRLFSKRLGYLVSGLADGTIKLWGGMTGSLYTTLSAHTSPVIGLSVYSSSAYAFTSASDDSTLNIWVFRSSTTYVLNRTISVESSAATIKSIRLLNGATNSITNMSTASSSAATNSTKSISRSNSATGSSNSDNTSTTTAPAGGILSAETLESGFLISQMNLNQTLDFLGNHLVENNCLTSCSGKSCQTDLLKCASHPCLNNGTCTDIISTQDNSTIYSFNCSCSQYYTGTSCENKIDICANETCSQNGYCKDVDHVATCECFYLIRGEHCDQPSTAKVLQQSVVDSSTVIALVRIACFYSLFVLLDLARLFPGVRRATRRIKVTRRNKAHKAGLKGREQLYYTCYACFTY
jgi:hypothetical protein